MIRLLHRLARWSLYGLIFIGPIAIAILAVSHLTNIYNPLIDSHGRQINAGIHESWVFVGLPALPVLIGIIGLRWLKPLTPS